MKIAIKLPILIMFLLWGSIYAQDVDLEGYGATGFRFYDRDLLNDYNQETYYEGKLQAEIKYNKQIKAQLDFRGNSNDNSVEFREFSIEYEMFERLWFKVGNIKRPFGYEYMIKREDLDAVDRSFLYQQTEDIGVGVRSVSFMAFYEYSKKRPEFPFTYMLSVFKDNSLVTGTAARLIYHTGELSYGLNYMFQNVGGDEPINTHGLALDVEYDVSGFTSSFELLYVQDHTEGLRRRLQGLDDIVYTTGAKAHSRYKIKYEDNEILKAIEPLVLLSYYQPDFDNADAHTLQFVTGINFYFDKDIRARFNADIRLTKNEFNEDYTTNQSRGVFEIQIRFD